LIWASCPKSRKNTRDEKDDCKENFEYDENFILIGKMRPKLICI